MPSRQFKKMSNLATALASVQSLSSAFWGVGADAIAAKLSAGVYEAPLRNRNVFPADNFNRDVTTSWWEAQVLDGVSAEASTHFSDTLKTASFIVLDDAMYDVRNT
jgi:hypothetical protein